MHFLGIIPPPPWITNQLTHEKNRSFSAALPEKAPEKNTEKQQQQKNSWHANPTGFHPVWKDPAKLLMFPVGKLARFY